MIWTSPASLHPKIEPIAHLTYPQFAPFLFKKITEAPGADASAAAAAAALKAAHSRAGARVHDLMPAYYSAYWHYDFVAWLRRRRKEKMKKTVASCFNFFFLSSADAHDLDPNT